MDKSYVYTVRGRYIEIEFMDWFVLDKQKTENGFLFETEISKYKGRHKIIYSESLEKKMVRTESVSK